MFRMSEVPLYCQPSRKPDLVPGVTPFGFEIRIRARCRIWSYLGFGHTHAFDLPNHHQRGRVCTSTEAVSGPFRVSGFWQCAYYRRTSLIRNCSPPEDHRRALGIALLHSPTRIWFIMREVPMYESRPTWPSCTGVARNQGHAPP